MMIRKLVEIIRTTKKDEFVVKLQKRISVEKRHYD